jgi:hypothetical protein
MISLQTLDVVKRGKVLKRVLANFRRNEVEPEEEVETIKISGEKKGRSVAVPGTSAIKFSVTRVS